jgi:hypothetical protein
MKDSFGSIRKTSSEACETHIKLSGTMPIKVQTMSTWQSAKENPTVVLFSLGACVNSALWGFDIGRRSFFVTNYR